MMITTTTNALNYNEIRMWLAQMWSEKGFWTKWQLRFSVILSLFLQLVLVFLGKRRKRLFTPWINIIIWSTYLSAGWFATVSLSTLLRSKGGLKDELVVFWTPFLILHLGGPDTITAYSLEDNEIWLRHLLALLIQVGTAFYINYKFRTNSSLQYISVFVLVVGIIKYGERIWVLRSASSKQFAQFIFSNTEVNETLPDADCHSTRPTYRTMDEHLSNKGVSLEARRVHKAFLSLKMFTPLVLDLYLSIYKQVMDIFTTKYTSAGDAFAMVDIELEFLFDQLYTKTPLFHTPVGAILRFICFALLTSTLLAFTVVLKMHEFSSIDLVISYLLLVSSIALEFYAIISNIFSPWTILWFYNTTTRMTMFLSRVLAYQTILANTIRKFGLIGQHNLIDYCIKSKSDNRVLKIFDTSNILQKYWHSSWKEVNPYIKDIIYAHLLDKRERYEASNYKNISSLLSERGDHGISKMGYDTYFALSWSLLEVKFDHSLLLWHIATDLCYHDDLIRYGESDYFHSQCQIGTSLSDYMLYLLVVRPSMLPEDISERRSKDTREEAMKFFPPTRLSRHDARVGLSRIDTSFHGWVETSRHKSVLFEACKLYQQLQSYESNYNWDIEEKWELINNVWVEMLVYAASKCTWKQHTLQLIHGKELLTHVSLLMLHLGLSQKIFVTDFPKKLEESNYYPPWEWEDIRDLAYYIP